MFTCIECGCEYSEVTGDTDERMCNDCMEGEQEYSITVTASLKGEINDCNN